MHVAAKAHFMREVAKAAQPKKSRRHYDNTSRSSRAVQKRHLKTSFKENGLSEARLVKVLSQETCLCNWALVRFFVLPCFLVFPLDVYQPFLRSMFTSRGLSRESIRAVQLLWCV